MLSPTLFCCLVSQHQVSPYKESYNMLALGEQPKNTGFLRGRSLDRGTVLLLAVATFVHEA